MAIFFNSVQLPNHPGQQLCWQERHNRQRGVLLLLVLSMLTLFLMIGILLLVMATRTRGTARAFAEASNTTTQGKIQQRPLLEEALMRLIRGPASGAMSESILEDKYGEGFLVGQLTDYTNEASHLISASITGIPTANALDLGGRIVTFIPRPEDSSRCSSFRIVRVFSGTSRFLLANLRPGEPGTLPGRNRLPCQAVINGREFTPLNPTSRNEPFDAYGTVNGIRTDPWLTQLRLENSTVVDVIPADVIPAFGSPGSAEVDNDNDGVADGIWIEGIFPDGTAADGGTLRHSVSYLVLDLDGRINVNAHGGYSPLIYPEKAWSPGSQNVPTGLGAGPAEVDASLLAPSVVDLTLPQPNQLAPEFLLPPAYGRVTNRWHALLGGSISYSDQAPLPPRLEPPFLSARHPDPLRRPPAIGDRSQADIAVRPVDGQRRSQQFLGDAVLAGRYGANRAPGIDDTIQLHGLELLPGDPPVPPSATWIAGPSTPPPAEPWVPPLRQFQSRSDQSERREQGDFWNEPGDYRNTETWMLAGNSPLDLKGRLRAFTSAAGPVPKLIFDAPSWTNLPVNEQQIHREELGSRGFLPTDFYGPIPEPNPGDELYYPRDRPIPPLTFDCEYTVHDLLNDPYELRLDANATRLPALSPTNSRDAVYTLAELEAVLRQFDADAAQLPARLATLFDDLSQRHRLTITTDSWDTPGLVGLAAWKVSRAAQAWNQGNNIYGVSSPDIAAGLRFDLNRAGMFRLISVLVPVGEDNDPGRVLQIYNDAQGWSLVERANRDCFGQPLIELRKQTGGTAIRPWRATSARRLPDEFMLASERNDFRLYHVAIERPAARQLYFRQLYTLLWMLASVGDNGGSRVLSPGESRELAQWAANVIEFRDLDSTMSRYDFDVNPANGWANNPAEMQVVFGVERPEILITETLAYDYPDTPDGNPAGRKFFLQFHRPWSASIRHEGVNIPTERIDPNLAPPVPADDPAANILDLGKTVPGTQDPIWRVVLRSRSGVGQSDPAQPPSNELNEPPPQNPPPAHPPTYQVVPFSRFVRNGGQRIGPNSTLIIEADESLLYLDADSRLPGEKGQEARAENTDVVYLQRLADPTRPFTPTGNANPYVVVDRAPVLVNVDGIQGVGDPVPNVRDPSFWKQAFASGPGGYLPGANPSQSGDWLHWPNRDYIGHAELMLVPGGVVTPAVVRVDDKGTMREETLWLDHLQWLTRYPDASLASADRIPEILDATIVPSRFINSAVTIPNPNVQLQDTLFTEIPCNQLSRWREAGRVNVNTVLPNQNNLPTPGQAELSKRSLIEQPMRFPGPGTISPNADPVPRSIDNAVLAAVGLDPNQQSPGNPFYAQQDRPVPRSIAELLLHPVLRTAAQANRNGEALRISRAIKMSNVGTVRSHMFAVWITLKTENTMTGDARTSRLFAIIDRSIPVGYRPGADLNAAETIRLKRFLE